MSAAEVIVRCSHCNDVALTKLAPDRFESSLYYAVLGSTRPLAEAGPDKLTLPNGRVIEIREAPGFCSQRCFEEIVRVTPPGGWRPVIDRPPVGGWLFFRGWKYKVLWDHRTEIQHAPPLAPSVLTFSLAQPEGGWE